MGQSLHVETQSQDPQQHNNGGETQDSFSNVCVLNSFAYLCSHLEGSQLMKNLTNREISDCIIGAAVSSLSDLLFIFTTTRMLKLCDRADESQLFSYIQRICVHVLILQQIFRCQTDLINALNVCYRFLQNTIQCKFRFVLECNC